MDNTRDNTGKKQLRKALEVVGGIMLLQGVVGLVHEFTGWLTWGLIQHLGFLDGREVYGSIALVVLAIAVLAAATSLPEKETLPEKQARPEQEAD